MTNKDYTKYLIIVDRSGSMSTIKDDTEGGFNAYIEEQKKVPGKADVTLVQFDNQYQVVYRNRPLESVPPLSLQPRGSTALHDAIGRAVTELGAELRNLPERERPGVVEVLVLTDGEENSSREWHAVTVKALVEQQQEKYNWIFHFLGANQDAVLTGTNLGFYGTHSITYAGSAVLDAFTSTANSSNVYRASLSSGESVLTARAASAYSDQDRADAVSDDDSTTA